MESTVFICPVCACALTKTQSEYYCKNNHRFDRAKSGYVNLLSGGTSGKVHGDDQMMVASRRRFLESGAYSPLKEAIVEEMAKVSPRIILDAGCGECYYTAAIKKELISAEAVFGVDMSKQALMAADKRKAGIDLAVASVYHLPVASESVDAVVSVFSPFAREEFLRVLRDGGYLFMVIPAARHLFELKELLYDQPYENEVAPYEVEGFDLCGRREIKYKFDLCSNEQILDLFSMTPYRYRTKGASDRLCRVNALCVSAEFELLIYQKQ